MDDAIDPLTRLAIHYGTDKWGPHFYTPVYHELFSRLRDRPIRLLEIGVGGYDLKTSGGASLAMWADYFPDAQITSIDIAEKRLAPHPRIKLYQGSQDDAALLRRVCDERGPFDVIIDDGSHVPKHVVASFQHLFPALADGGTYVIEDMQTAFWPQFGGSILHGGDIVKLARTLIECLNHAEVLVADRTHVFPSFARAIKSFRAFHNLFVIEKGDNHEPSNYAYDLQNPCAARAVQTIERELERTPTAAGMANLVGLYLRGGNAARAKEIADRALAQWPTDAAVLTAAHTVAARRGDIPAKIDCLERLLQIEPDNAVLQRTLAEARVQPNPPQPRRND
jgi:tetratricopeptide (TPR) repeat protein